MIRRENVWSYPRPPCLEATSKRLLVEVGGQVVADTVSGYRVLETSHPPTYYLPPMDCATALFCPSVRKTVCEFKGEAQYFDLVIDEKVYVSALWCYPNPTRDFQAIAGFLSFYAGAMDRCSVDGEIVQAQAGDFYGGWVTSDIEGPFKGPPGTYGW